MFYIILTGVYRGFSQSRQEIETSLPSPQRSFFQLIQSCKTYTDINSTVKEHKGQLYVNNAVQLRKRHVASVLM